MLRAFACVRAWRVHTTRGAFVSDLNGSTFAVCDARKQMGIVVLVSEEVVRAVLEVCEFGPAIAVEVAYQRRMAVIGATYEITATRIVTPFR